MSDFVSIPVHRDTRELLKSRGCKGQTYDGLIRRLLDIADHASIMEAHYGRLSESDDFTPLEDL